MENRKRPVKLNVRFTEEEYAALKEKAEEAGLSMNDFIRKLVAGKEFNTRPPQEANKLLWELYAVAATSAASWQRLTRPIWQTLRRCGRCWPTSTWRWTKS